MSDKWVVCTYDEERIVGGTRPPPTPIAEFRGPKTATEFAAEREQNDEYTHIRRTDKLFEDSKLRLYPVMPLNKMKKQYLGAES